MVDLRVGVLGANSLVGGCLLPQLCDGGWTVVAYSRQNIESGGAVSWRQLPSVGAVKELSHWVCLAPIWVLPEYFGLIEASGARRLVALSSTSRFTKIDSRDSADKMTAAKLVEGEARVQAWAGSRGIEWVILRPTMIHGFGRDRTISEVARFIRRFGFFPVLGQAQGLRQPIHAVDVATACLSALQVSVAANRAYNISGSETITYREMVTRIFLALGCRARIVEVPLWVFRLSVTALRVIPRYRNWSPAMAERMSQNLVFEHIDAARDLGFKPKGFVVSSDDFVWLEQETIS